MRPVPDAVNTVICAPDDGWCNPPKHAEQFAAINKLDTVTSCWTIINIRGLLEKYPTVFFYANT